MIFRNISFYETQFSDIGFSFYTEKQKSYSTKVIIKKTTEKFSYYLCIVYNSNYVNLDLTFKTLQRNSYLMTSNIPFIFDNQTHKELIENIL